ncbi:MAG: triphosphoribosyl-dephospho-CoA synthase [Pirellulales bacterium]|nr:triphosphoribosyl-dephospho-CoA synthase [Pirellulales bacterium]
MASYRNALSTGQCATLACLWEVAAPKPGNVHRGADFDDMVLQDFLASAVAIGPAMDAAVERPLGRTVLAAVEVTRQTAGTNTNLGTVLLLAPLAKVSRELPLREGVVDVLSRLTPADASNVYHAIALAQPGGLGRVDEYDVAEQPPVDLIAAMQSAAGRDMVARQYAEGFSQVFQCVVPWLKEGIRRGQPVAGAVVHLHVQLMAAFPDSLIARKCGLKIAAESAARAASVLAAGVPGEEDYRRALADLDFWLRSDGHRRNPGTTADLVAAGLFIGLRDNWLPTHTSQTPAVECQ